MPQPKNLRLRIGLWLALGCLALAACRHRSAVAHWYRGNLHTHSLWSDGTLLPEVVVGWYASHGYQFVGLSEHDVLPTSERWLDISKLSSVGAAEPTTTPGVPLDTRVRDGSRELRLQTLSQLKRHFERPGRFLLLCNEEVSSADADHPIHLTAVNVAHAVAPVREATAALALEHTLEGVQGQSRMQGYPAIGVVNHPNFEWAVGAADLAQVRTARFVEVFNGHPFTASRGDTGKRSVERLWDMANAERVLERHFLPLFGVASDDTHFASGARDPSPGRGWIVVRATTLRASALVDSLERGDFYASTGVRLKQLDYDTCRRTLSLVIDPEPATTYQTEFIATKTTAKPASAVDANDRWDTPRVGVVVATTAALDSRYRLADDDAFVRARVTASRRPDNPIESDYTGDAVQFEQAFTQPVGWEGR